MKEKQIEDRIEMKKEIIEMYDTKNERNKRIQRRESFMCPVCTRHWAPMACPCD